LKKPKKSRNIPLGWLEGAGAAAEPAAIFAISVYAGFVLENWLKREIFPELPEAAGKYEFWKKIKK